MSKCMNSISKDEGLKSLFLKKICSCSCNCSTKCFCKSIIEEKNLEKS